MEQLQKNENRQCSWPIPEVGSTIRLLRSQSNLLVSSRCSIFVEAGLVADGYREKPIIPFICRLLACKHRV